MGKIKLGLQVLKIVGGKLGTVLGILKVVKSIIKMLRNLYNRYQDSQIDRHYKNKRERRNRLLAQLIQARKNGDDDALKEIQRKISSLNGTHNP